MKSRCLLVSLILLFSIISISALTVDTEFQKLANYAAEYETGNINYVQLLLYTSAVRENLNEILGVVSQDNGGIVKENQIQSILGTPTEQTNWVWSEGANKEMRLDKDVSVWRKIVFDGRKIQIRLNAQPSIFSKGNNNQDNSNSQSELEGRLVYRLNFETEFKKPENQLNIEGKINEIKTLAQSFSSDPSSANAENLAKESVSAERIFESYFKQAGGKCEDVMSQVFGSENKKTSQNMFVKEISFCEGDNYDVIARLEMCDDCEWNWISVNFDIRGRGPGFKPVQNSDNSLSMDNYKTKSATELQSEVTSLITQAITSCQNKDISSLMAIQNKLKMANEAWNQKSNDLWQEVNKIYETQNQAMSQEERMRFDQSYGWIKQEQEKRQKIKELTKASYETRKQFYINLFSSYESKDSYYTQIEYQKTLFEDFKQVGQEICDNNVDDNKDNAIDCADSQCGGKICGKGTSTTSNSTEQVDFYCIQSTCQAKQEMKTIEIVTSNNTLACPEVPVITCEEGSKVFFSKYDTETNCPLESSCLKETTSCSVNEDCSQPACGFAECIQGSCQVTSLTECRPPECTDGEERICDSSGIITEICTDGFWEKTGECTTVTEIKEEPIGGNECLTAGDCGADSVCNNGFCQSLPQVILVPVEESTTGEVIQETQNTETSNPELEIRQETGTTQETNPAETQQESAQTKEVPQTTSEPIPTISGAAILEFFEPLISKIKILGLAITGYEGEAPLETPVETPTQPPTDNLAPQPSINEDPMPPTDNPQNPVNEVINTVNQPDNNQQNQQNNQDQENERRRADDARRQEEDKKRCTDNCVRPCIEDCIRKACEVNNFECNVEETQKTCASSCSPKDSCMEKCLSGQDMRDEFQKEEPPKQQQSAFQVGGTCRTDKGQTQGFVWFNGWGEIFEQVQPLKDKYYQGGQGDWCKYDYENLIKQRAEFENGFDQKFVSWFFEKYLANSADNWQQSVSGIFELYWKDVENSKQLADRMQCLEMSELPAINLINVKYDTEYGRIEFWEEIKTVKQEGTGKEIQMITPYMKSWVFPPKEFMISQMKKAMKNHEFPGSPEDKADRKNGEGPTAEEREMIKQDPGFMNFLKKISEKYNGNLDVVVQFKDSATGDVVFNLYAQVNENDIFKMQPMLPEEVPAEDIRIEIDFNNIYEMILATQKDISGEQVQSPPWGPQFRPVQKVKEITNGIKSFFKIRSIISSAKITPESARGDVKTIINKFISMMMKGGDKDQGSLGSKQDSESDSESSNGIKLTGQVISDGDQKGPPANAGQIPSFGPSAADEQCMMTCMKCTSLGVGCSGNQSECQTKCDVVKPEQTSEESCVETCAKKGCGEFDFSCQEKNRAVCDKECGMIKEPSAKSEEEQCIRDCVNAESPGTICGGGEGGEKGNALCQKCAKSCEYLYAGPCLDEMKLEDAKSACNTCDKCYGKPVMGDSGEGYECIVGIECADASSEFGDDAGTGPGVGQEGFVAKVGNAIGNAFDGIGDFFKNIFS